MRISKWHRPYLNLPPADFQRIEEILPILGLDSISEFTRSAVLDKLRRIEAEMRRLDTDRLGDPATRRRLAVLGFVRDGCRSVEDVRSVCQVLTPLEIEAILFALEQDGMLDRKDAKRGRTWQWELTPKGEEYLREKGLA
jgi:hypothetical protein